jgi:hypothetical protein
MGVFLRALFIMWVKKYTLPFEICIDLQVKEKNTHTRTKARARGCIQKFPDWVDNEIYAYLRYYSLRSNTKDYGDKTH